jgi:phosphomannomutase
VSAIDPDRDRLAFMAKTDETEFEIFTGNETGALLAECEISQLKVVRKTPTKGSIKLPILMG